MDNTTAYINLRDALSALIMSLSGYINNPNTADQDANAARNVERAADTYLTRLGQFQLEQFDGAKLVTATQAVQGVTSSVGGGVAGTEISTRWAGARPVVEAAIPALTAVQALSSVPGPHRELALTLKRAASPGP